METNKCCVFPVSALAELQPRLALATPAAKRRLSGEKEIHNIYEFPPLFGTMVKYRRNRTLPPVTITIATFLILIMLMQLLNLLLIIILNEPKD